jgi:hypothetical protein
MGLAGRDALGTTLAFIPHRNLEAIKPDFRSTADWNTSSFRKSSRIQRGVDFRIGSKSLCTQSRRDTIFRRKSRGFHNRDSAKQCFFYYSNINLWLRTLLFIVIRVVLLPFQQVITNIEKVIRKQLAKICLDFQMQLTIEYIRQMVRARR